MIEDGKVTPASGPGTPEVSPNEVFTKPGRPPRRKKQPSGNNAPEPENVFDPTAFTTQVLAPEPSQADSSATTPIQAHSESDQPAKSPIKTFWQGAWIRSDDGLNASRQVVGQISLDGGYLAGHQKMFRGEPGKPIWDDELFPNLLQAEQRSKLYAIRAFDKPESVPAPPQSKAASDTPDAQSAIEKVESIDSILSSDVDKALALLKAQYLLADNKFYFRDKSKTLAFEDGGRKITTAHNSSEVARSMLELAKSKGWSHVRLNGSDEFKRKAWVEAELMGMKSSAYVPDEFDQSELAQRRATASVDTPEMNSVSKEAAPAMNAGSPAVGQRRALTPGVNQSDLATRYGTRLAKDLQDALSRMGYVPNGPESNLVLDHVAGLATSPRTFVGTLIDQGEAPYEFNDRAAKNYFVRLETPYGEKVVWGIDIPRALSMAQGPAIARGEEILLAFKGSEAVTFKDELTGQIIQTHRNTWYAERTSELVNIASTATGKPTYINGPETAQSRAGQGDLQQPRAHQMLAEVLKQKGAPQGAMDKALSIVAQIPKAAQTAVGTYSQTPKPHL